MSDELRAVTHHSSLITHHFYGDEEKHREEGDEGPCEVEEGRGRVEVGRTGEEARRDARDGRDGLPRLAPRQVVG